MQSAMNVGLPGVESMMFLSARVFLEATVRKPYESPSVRWLSKIRAPSAPTTAMFRPLKSRTV